MPHKLLNLILSIAIVAIAQLIVHNNFDDNIEYRLGYETIKDIEFINSFNEYRLVTGASEPFFVLYNFVVSSIFSYEISILIINLSFLFFFIKL